MSARNIVVFILLAVGAIGSWYLSRQYQADDVDENHFDPARRGYYLKSARILGTGPDGNLLYEIQAERAEQRENDRIAFTDVLISYSPQSEISWVVNADTATIHKDEQIVLLQGHVKAVSSAGLSGNDTEIRTQYLEFDPENYLAETDRRVQIRIGARSLTATGMLASLNENRLELKSNVSGKFVP